MVMMKINNYHHSGFALVILIWILSLLSLMAASFTQTIRREMSISNGIKENANALALAETWLMITGLMLSHPNPQQRWVANGAIYHANLKLNEVRIRAFSETGKVNINTAKDDLLHAVINYSVKDVNQQNALLDAIVDWRDADDDPHPAGAEASQYTKKGLTYQPSNQPFQSLEELQLVFGMDEEIFNDIKEFITVYAEKPEIEYALASEELLRLILADYQNRDIHDIDLENQLKNRQDNRFLSNELIEKSEIYTVIVETRMADTSTAVIEAVIKPQNQQPNVILDWRYGQKNRSLFDDYFINQVIFFQNEFTYNN